VGSEWQLGLPLLPLAGSTSAHETHPPAVTQNAKLEADKAAAQVSTRVPNHLSPGSCAAQGLDNAQPMGLVEILSR
jgi:hypothetical protein